MTAGTPAQADKDGLRLERTQKWGEALAQMVAALRILDESQAPIQIGAHLDLAISGLREEIASAKGAVR